MEKTEKARMYYAVRRVQKKIASYLSFSEGELLQIYERENVQKYATYLAQMYFARSAKKELQIYEEAVEMYRIYLILAPIIQKIPLSFKIDWTRGHFLSFLRSQTNRKINRKYVRVRIIERKIDVEKLVANMQKLGIKDNLFISKIVEVYRKNYTLNTLRGRLAAAMFDPFMFVNEREGYELMRGNELIRMEKSKFEGAVDIDKQDVKIWDYVLKREINSKNGKTTLRIKIAEENIKAVKARIKDILASSQSPERKRALIYKAYMSLIDKHKYTKDAYEQMLDLKKWLAKRVKKLAATDKEILSVKGIVKEWEEKKFTKMVFKQPNFFWDPREIKEETYKYFFSPYRIF